MQALDASEQRIDTIERSMAILEKTNLARATGRWYTVGTLDLRARQAVTETIRKTEVGNEVHVVRFHSDGRFVLDIVKVAECSDKDKRLSYTWTDPNREECTEECTDGAPGGRPLQMPVQSTEGFPL